MLRPIPKRWTPVNFIVMSSKWIKLRWQNQWSRSGATSRQTSRPPQQDSPSGSSSQTRCQSCPSHVFNIVQQSAISNFLLAISFYYVPYRQTPQERRRRKKNLRKSSDCYFALKLPRISKTITCQFPMQLMFIVQKSFDHDPFEIM